MKKIRYYDELLPLVEEMGMLPLFPGAVPRLSLWDFTYRKYWFTGNEEYDPWYWRERAAREGRLAYGKFYNGKAGFLSLNLLPDFVNFRRNGQTFEDYFDTKKIPVETAAIMEQFRYGDEYVSSDLKRITGIKKSFDLRITLLQHRTFLTTCDFSQKKTKTGRPYGWAVAVLCKPESIFGQSLVQSRFSVTPETSYEILFRHCIETFPKIPAPVWRKFLV